MQETQETRVRVFSELGNGKSLYLKGRDGETDIENRVLDTGRGEERVRCMERIIWKLIVPYVK